MKRRALERTPDAAPAAADMREPSGNDAAEFWSIAELHRPYLRTVALRLAGDEDTAMDLVHETLMRAQEHYRTAKHAAYVRTWLCRILTNLFLDHNKHGHVERRGNDQMAVLVVAVCEIDAERAEPPDAVLWAAVDRLEPIFRAVVDCCYRRRMSYKEAAAELDIPIGTVATRLKRAIELLREALRGVRS